MPSGVKQVRPVDETRRLCQWGLRVSLEFVPSPVFDDSDPERNGTYTLTSRQIDQIIKTSRSQKPKR